MGMQYADAVINRILKPFIYNIYFLYILYFINSLKQRRFGLGI